MNYKKSQIEQIGHIKSIQLRNPDGDRSHWLDLNWKEEQGIKNILENDFSVHYNQLEEHQGYRNIFTFIASLELWNTATDTERWIDLGQMMLSRCDDEEEATQKVWEQLTVWFDSYNPLKEQNNHFASLLHHAISFIDLKELAEEVIQRAKEATAEPA